MKTELERLAERRLELYRKRWAAEITSDEQDELDAICDALRQSSMTAHARRAASVRTANVHAGDAFFAIFGMTRVGES